MADVELHDEVVAWLDTLTDSEWQRVVVIVDRLSELGHQARMPLSRSLGDGLFELRFALGPTARRITYRFTKDSADHPADHVPQATQQRTPRDRPSTHRSRRVCPALPMNPKPNEANGGGGDDGQLLTLD